MAQNWPIAKLGEVIDLFDSQRIPLNGQQRRVRQGKFPYYGAQGIIDYIDNYIFDGSYILVAEDGENLNSKKLPIALLASGKFWVNNHAHILRGQKNILDDKFLLACLNNTDITPYVTGAAQPKLSQGNLRQIEIPLPPLPIQKRIAGILSAYDELIENSQRRIKMLESMARGLYREWFVHFRFPGHENHPKVPSPLGDIPKGWEVKKLSDTCECIVDSEHKTAPTEVVGFPMIRTPNIGKGYLLLDDARCVSEEIYAAWTRRAVPKEGDLILAREAPVGNVGIVGKGAVVCLGQRTVLIRANSKIIDTHILLRILLGDYCQNAFLGAASGATVSHLNLADIRNMSIPCPPIYIQSQMCPVFRAIDHNIGYLLRKNQNLRRTRDLLLPRLLSGQIDLKVD